jgi:uncharacterized membrane protein YdjX (TVP38/TMEM64 family)
MPQAVLRLAVALTLLAACVIVPFGLWGERLDAAAPALLHEESRPLLIAAVGIALLVADVLLPVPSSVVGVALCWLLGPLWGGLTLAFGLTLSFACGYVLGRAVPEHRLRVWMGAGVWDAVRGHAKRRAWWWIALARPLPVLAEMTAVLAGVWRVPPVTAIGSAGLSSIAVGALYAAAAWLGRDQPDVLSAFAVSLALPALAWFVHRRVLVRLRRG